MGAILPDSAEVAVDCSADQFSRWCASLRLMVDELLGHSLGELNLRLDHHDGPHRIR